MFFLVVLEVLAFGNEEETPETGKSINLLGEMGEFCTQDGPLYLIVELGETQKITGFPPQACR